MGAGQGHRKDQSWRWGEVGGSTPRGLDGAGGLSSLGESISDRSLLSKGLSDPLGGRTACKAKIRERGRARGISFLVIWRQGGVGWRKGWTKWL